MHGKEVFCSYTPKLLKNWAGEKVTRITGDLCGPLWTGDDGDELYSETGLPDLICE